MENGITEDFDKTQYKYESPIPGVHIYSDVWPDAMKYFEELLEPEFWEKNADDPGYTKWVREDFFDDKRWTRENGKQSDTCWIYHWPEAVEAIKGPINSYLNHWTIDAHSRESLRISRYSPGEFFGAHSDDTFSTPRTVSVVYYPNDDYEGGELEFIHFGVKIKPKANQLFIFPSSYSYEHIIHDVLKFGKASILFIIIFIL